MFIKLTIDNEEGIIAISKALIQRKIHFAYKGDNFLLLLEEDMDRARGLLVELSIRFAFNWRL